MKNKKFTFFQNQVIEQLNHDIAILLTNSQLPSSLFDACHYAMMGSGKRVRPLLVANTFASFHSHGNEKITIPTAVRRSMLAVELLHTYSLIHDDLPCMDDDDLRRGRPTCHVKFGEATALLAGDVLQTLAFEVFNAKLPTFDDSINDAECHNTSLPYQLLQIFAPRARRMVSGQMLDIDGEKKSLTQSELQKIHQDKTGALIEASVLMGAVCARSDIVIFNALQEFSQCLGLAFQVQDDVLDVTADTVQLGKPTGSDEKLEKSTYVKLMGIDGAKDYAKILFNRCSQTLNGFTDTDDSISVHNNHNTTFYLNLFSNTLWARKK